MQLVIMYICCCAFVCILVENLFLFYCSIEQKKIKIKQNPNKWTAINECDDDGGGGGGENRIKLTWFHTVMESRWGQTRIRYSYIYMYILEMNQNYANKIIWDYLIGVNSS